MAISISTVILTLLMMTLAYLIGSISSAILFSRMFHLPDPRTTGSKNPGATNVLRNSHVFIALLVLGGDIIKGTIPVWSAYFLDLPPLSLGLIALAVCLGHMYPLFFQFAGGKAVATAFGVLLPIGFDLGGLLIITWVLIALLTRYSSLAAIVTVLLSPFYTWLLKPDYLLPVVMLSILIILRHKANIIRLLKGTEVKISFKN